MGYLDSKERKFGFSEPYHLTGDFVVDMNHIRNFYSDKNGIIPTNMSTIYLKQEKKKVE